MKYPLFLSFLGALLVLTACQKEDPNQTIDYAYHAHIQSPLSLDKNRGQLLHLKVLFESHSGEPVHHIQVRIYKKADNTEVYNEPEKANVRAVDGEYLFEDTIELSPTNGFEDGHYVMEAKVWGEATGEGEELETVEFHVQ